MDRKKQHHEHHRHEREERKKKHKLDAQQRSGPSISTTWVVVGGVLLAASVVALWIYVF